MNWNCRRSVPKHGEEDGGEEDGAYGQCFMCGGVHYGEVEGLVSVERWSCSRGASCVVEYTMGRLRDWSL